MQPKACFASFFPSSSDFPLNPPNPPRAPEVSPADFERLAAFRYALRKFLRFSEEAAIATGLPPQQYQALLAIKGFRPSDPRPMIVGDLAESLQVEHHTAVGLINRMIKEELVAKHQSAGDRRQMQLSLTTRGETLLAGLAMTHRTELRRLSPQLQTLLDQLADAPSES